MTAEVIANHTTKPIQDIGIFLLQQRAMPFCYKPIQVGTRAHWLARNTSSITGFHPASHAPSARFSGGGCRPTVALLIRMRTTATFRESNNWDGMLRLGAQVLAHTAAHAQ
jgi:hypothetical protein